MSGSRKRNFEPYIQRPEAGRRHGLRPAALGRPRLGRSDFSTFSRRQKNLQVRIPLQKKQGRLHLLVDSTGFKMKGEDEWRVKKHGADYRREWRQQDLEIDAETLEIRAIEVTVNCTSDATPLC